MADSNRSDMTNRSAQGGGASGNAGVARPGAMRPSGFQDLAPRLEPWAAEQSPSVGSEAKEVVSHAVDQAKELAMDQLATRSEKSSQELRAVADGLRGMTEQLEGNAAAPYVTKAADQIDRLSRYIQGAQPRDVQRSVESFARKEPLLFLGGAFALGIAAVRLLKSSPAETEAPSPGAALR